jgi:hypothetical protein
MLALAQPAEAKIIYTPANVKLPMDVDYPLDLNHDGKADFSFYQGTGNCHGGYCNSTLRVFKLMAGNRVWGQRPLNYASALRAGVRVGTHGKFSNSASVMARWGCSPQNCPEFYGPWANGGNGVQNRYLGFKFQIKGKTHFGWARLTVRFNFQWDTTLTGYAYETVANKSIITGKTKGPDEASSVGPANAPAFSATTAKPATLGLLAMGSPGLSIWRREEQPAAAQ